MSVQVHRWTFRNNGVVFREEGLLSPIITLANIHMSFRLVSSEEDR